MLHEHSNLVECPMCISGFVCVDYQDAGKYGVYDVWETCPTCDGLMEIPEADLLVLKLQGKV